MRGVNWDRNALRAELGKWLQMVCKVTAECGGKGGAFGRPIWGVMVGLWIAAFYVRLRSACCMHSFAISSSVYPTDFKESASSPFQSASSWSMSVLVRPVPTAMAVAEGVVLG